MAVNRTIGKGGTLPWDLKEDRARFRKLTLGHGVVMGRKTFLSIGHPLDGRNNYVLTRNPNYNPSGVWIVHNLDEVFHIVEENGEEILFIIGGAEVYAEFLPYADRMELTILRRPFEGDVFFPPFSVKDWVVTNRLEGSRPVGDRLEHEYVSLRRRDLTSEDLGYSIEDFLY